MSKSLPPGRLAPYLREFSYFSLVFGLKGTALPWTEGNSIISLVWTKGRRKKEFTRTVKRGKKGWLFGKD